MNGALVQAEKGVALAKFITVVGPEGAIGLLMCPAGHRVRKTLRHSWQDKGFSLMSQLPPILLQLCLQSLSPKQSPQ